MLATSETRKFSSLLKYTLISLYFTTLKYGWMAINFHFHSLKILIIIQIIPVDNIKTHLVNLQTVVLTANKHKVSSWERFKVCIDYIMFKREVHQEETSVGVNAP